VFSAIAMLVNLSWCDVNRRVITSAGAIFDVVEAMSCFQVCSAYACMCVSDKACDSEGLGRAAAKGLDHVARSSSGLKVLRCCAPRSISNRRLGAQC